MNKLDVAIMGEFQFHNQLLQNFIENRFKLRCDCKNILCISSQTEGLPPETKLLLWDCLGSTSDEIRVNFERCFSKELEPYKVVFFNLQPGADLESEALAHGVKGVFYLKDTLDKFEKGIQAVLSDELWFSRETISKYLNKAQQLSRNQADGNPAASLTSREKQILSMVATGSNNRKIAENLCISPHTVKTHLNNIFGKIKVSDRTQALLWTFKYL